MIYYPICFNTENKKILVVGGGKAALLKINSLLNTSAEITVISKDFSFDTSEFKKEYKNLNFIKDNFEINKIKTEYDMAFICTDNTKLNTEIREFFKHKKTIVMSADNKKESDFITSAIIQKENITISVNTQGKSPTAAKLILNEIEKLLTEDFTEKINLVCKIRELLLKEKEVNSNINIKDIMDSLNLKSNRELMDIINDIKDKRYTGD
ncbi:MAG: siroheme synthase [Bacillota bacterium]|nr:siroheme synthase [Bacillota bacterium]